MKIKLLIFLLLIISSDLLSQNFNCIASADYEMYYGGSIYSATLFFNEINSKFIYKEKAFQASNIEPQNDYDDRVIQLKDTTEYYVSTDKRRQITYSKEMAFTDEGIKYFLVKEKTPNISWDLKSGMKKVNNIECHLAQTTFRGRTYDAWYAPSIPVNFGVWKLNNLPGLILELSDSSNEIIIHLKRISIPFEKQIQFIEDLEVIPLKKHLKNKHKNLEGILRKVKSKMNRKFQVDFSIDTSKEFELNYDDIGE